MISPSAVLAGILGAAAFTFGWILNPTQPAVLVTAFVCGLATVFGQMATRDLLARALSLVERGADEMMTDGGQLLAQAETMRKRIARLTMVALVSGVLAPASATMHTIIVHPFFSGAAFAFGIIAFLLSFQLYYANSSLTDIIIRDRSKRAIAKQQKVALEKQKPEDPTSSNQGNLRGFELISSPE